MSDKLGGVQMLSGSAVPDFDKVNVSGSVELVIMFDSQAEPNISWPEGAVSVGLDVEVSSDVLWIKVDGKRAERPVVEVTVTMAKLMAASDGATVVAAGEAEEMVVVASSGAEIDASNLQLKSAEVELETKARVKLSATDSVTGGVGYGAELWLVGEPSHTKIATGNRGAIYP